VQWTTKPLRLQRPRKGFGDRDSNGWIKDEVKRELYLPKLQEVGPQLYGPRVYCAIEKFMKIAEFCVDLHNHPN
jgi:hypothetical protein